MANHTDNVYRIVGRVINRENRRAVAGMRVEAWDKDHQYHEPVGSATTVIGE